MAIEDEIVRHIELQATQEQVWHAITNHHKFGEWFECVVESRFVVGEVTSCYSEHAGVKVHWQILVKALEPQSYFAYVWSPGETGADLYDESAGQTLVEFSLEPYGLGTQLTIRESGFASLPADMQRQSFTRNTQGWDAQVQNITQYVE